MPAGLKVNYTLCPYSNEPFIDDWEERHHTGICLHDTTQGDGLLQCEDSLRMTVCNETYQYIKTLYDEGHGVSQTAGLMVLCTLSVLLNIYFLVYSYYKNRRKLKKDISRQFSRHGQSNGVIDKSVEPSDNLESVDSDNAGQNLNQIDPNQAVMIGDDALDDVNGAINAGLKGILVKSGKYRPGDEEKCPGATFIGDDFSSVVEYLIENEMRV